MSKFSFVLLPTYHALACAVEVDGRFMQWFRDTYPGIFASSPAQMIVDYIYRGGFAGFDIETAALLDGLLKKDGVSDAEWFNSNDVSDDETVVTMDRWVDEIIPNLEKLAKIVGGMRRAEGLYLYNTYDDNFEIAHALLDGRAVWHNEKKNKVVHIGDNSVEFLS